MTSGPYTPREFAALLRKKADEVPFDMGEAAHRIVTHMEAMLRAESPVSSGRLAASQHSDTDLVGQHEAVGVAGTLRTAPEGMYLRTGTGIFGPENRVIRARRRRALRLDIGAGLFRASQRGTRKNDYFDHVIHQEGLTVVPTEFDRLGEAVADLER